MRIPSNLLVDVAVLCVMSLAALWGVAYGWWHWRGAFAIESLPFWRRTVATIGLSLVTLHGLLCAFLWTGLGTSHLPFAYQAYRVAPLFLAAVPCIFAGKGASRWWLLLSSSLLFVLCFSIMLND
jgi:hypothetical protein